MPITTSSDRGCVVLLPFPFSDLSGVKLRAAVIVSPRYPSDGLLVVALTSVGGALRPGEFSIRSWRQAGLLHPSYAKRALASVSGDLAQESLEYLQAEDLERLEDSLRLWLRLKTV